MSLGTLLQAKPSRKLGSGCCCEATCLDSTAETVEAKSPCAMRPALQLLSLVTGLKKGAEMLVRFKSYMVRVWSIKWDDAVTYGFWLANQ